MSRDAGPVKGGKTVIAFVDDPTGYKASGCRLVLAHAACLRSPAAGDCALWTTPPGTRGALLLWAWGASRPTWNA